MDKEQIIVEKSKNILIDFGREFKDESFKVFKPDEVKKNNYYNFQYDVWEIFINVPDEQFGGFGIFSIYFIGETMEPFMFHDGAAEGRTPNLKIIKKNGKYEIGDEWKNE